MKISTMVLKTKVLKIKETIASNKGAVLLMFALVLPIYLSLCALAIDGPLAMLKKARLSDGLNQAVLAVAAVNNGGGTATDIQTNNQILLDYLRAYMPTAKLELANMDVRANTVGENVTYRATATADVASILPLDHVGLPSFGKNIGLGNNGNVTKKIQTQPIDMVLVVDFSRSMAQKNVPGTAKTRITVLQEVVNEVLTQGLKTAGSRFGIVPYDIGVPVKVTSRNVLGGQEIGCSVQFVPKSNYKIDYAFWADKFVDLDNKLLNDPQYQFSKQEIYWKMDNAMMNYYVNIVLPAAVGTTNPDKQYLIDQNYCVPNSVNQVGRAEGRALYSCWQSSNSIFTHSAKVDSEYSNMIENLKSMRSPLENAKGYRSIANIDSIDFTATMNKMFDRNNIVEFIQPWAANLQEFRAFGEMCQSGMAMSPTFAPTESVLKEPDGYDSTSIKVSAAYDTAQKSLSNARQNTFIIPLTNNRTTLNAFQTMVPSGGTDTISGVLRALPELMDNPTAINNKRVMVIVSDGFDSDPFDNKATDNLALARKFIDLGLCDKIRDGFTAKNLELSMYFISLSAADLKQEELLLWAQCVGADKVSVADSFQTLLATFSSILQTETGYFIN